MPKKPGRSRGALEQEILACLAAAGRPLTPSEVLADMRGDLAYTTVMTTLARLHQKQALAREQVGRAYAYSLPGGPAAAHSSVTAFQMRRLLDRDTDRAGVLARFVADLTADDERLLTELLAQDRAEDGETP